MRLPLQSIGSRWDKAKRERGQSLVELALSIPLLLMLVMGIIDLGFVLSAHVQVAAASGQGARAGSLFAGDELLTRDVNESNRLAVIQQAILSSMGTLNTTSPNFDVNTDVQVSYPERDLSNPTGEGERISVMVRYRQPLRFDLLPNSIPGVSSGYFTVSSTTTMRIQ